MVMVALALDTPELSPEVMAWEKEPTVPEAAPDEDVLEVVPRLVIQPGIILREPVSSEIGERCAPGALILTAAERHADYSAEALAAAICGGDKQVSGVGGYGNSRGTSATVVEREMAALGVKHRRDGNEVDARGFRRSIVCRLMEPDPTIETLAFGITRRAARPNIAAVCGRNTFHSEQRCREQLSRQRDATDYLYVSAKHTERGANDPASYSVSCKHERMKLLLRMGLEQYNAKMVRVAEEREKLAKDAALQAKIELGKVQLANRRAKEDAEARSLARKADARRLKVSVGADRVRRKWMLRLQDSLVIEIRGAWEKRKDSGGSVFYACSNRGTQEPFSWDPPEEWEQEGVSAGRETSPVSGTTAEDDSRPGTAQDDGNGLSTTAGLESLGLPEPGTVDEGTGGSFFPRKYSQEEKLTFAVSQLAENEQLLDALAWRLGIPREEIRRDGREPLLARGNGGVVGLEGDGVGGDGTEGTGENGGGNGSRVKTSCGDEDEEEMSENREQIELGEHDDFYDSDDEQGDARESPGPLPQDHSDVRRIRIEERKGIIEESQRYGAKQPWERPRVPPLSLEVDARGGEGLSLAPVGAPAPESLEAQLGGLGWRRLAREDVGPKLLETMLNPRMQGPRPEAANATGPKCRPVEAIDPTLASRTCQQFQVDPAVMFVQDVVEEHARVMREAKRRMRVVEELEDDASTEFDPAKFSAQGPQEFTSAERRLMALAEDDGRSKAEIKETNANARAIIASKMGNIQELESLIGEEKVSPDVKDADGNTLLLLAAQQGHKRTMKFLLRKGATMNDQNHDGNSVLHFCYASGRSELGEYLKTKGADDSLLNAQGLTCYEGLSAELVQVI